MADKRVAVIGAGNVAWSLAPAIHALDGWRVTRVAARHRERAVELAEEMPGAEAVSVEDLAGAVSRGEVDCVVISVADDAIAPLAAALPPSERVLWLHTSGSVDASALSPLGGRHGVLYPLQTFTRRRLVPLAEVPLFVEATDAAMADVEALAGALSATVRHAGSELRRRVHIAAVFGCNFTNHLLAIAERLLQADGLPLSTLEPLVRETLAKAFESSPLLGQTGPARRGDTRVTDAHIACLSEADALIYRTLTDSIINTYRNEPH